MGPAPSADLVGSMLSVEAEEGYINDRATLRRTAKKASPGVSSEATGQAKASQDESRDKQAPLQIVWRNVLIFIYLHAAALYGFYLCFTAAKGSTLIWCK